MRRLPVYLLLDCSESLIGEGIRQIERGVNTLLSTLRSDPHALETVWLSCITFDGAARVDFPLTEIAEVQPPKLMVRPGTSLGAALNLCADRIQAEVRKTSHDNKGDYRPLIILITDGQATDDCQTALQRLGAAVKPTPASIYAIGCGDDVDLHALKKLSDVVLHMPEMEEADFKKLFIWLTASVQSASIAVEGADPRAAALAKLPDTILKVDRLPPPPAPDAPARQVFLRSLCVKSKQPFLIRYRMDERHGVYFPLSSHPLDESGVGNAVMKLPSVNSNLLNGAYPCPFCGNPGAGSCGNCGTVFCSDGPTGGAVTCPGCGNILTSRNAENGEGFQVRQSAG
jgi:uncharacterized protein YegL